MQSVLIVQKSIPGVDWNSTLVRSYIGYVRLDNVGVWQCAALNALYDQLWVYYNLVPAGARTWVGKVVVDGKVRWRWNRAQTPCHRLLARGILSQEQEARLAILYAETNPRQLRKGIYKR